MITMQYYALAGAFAQAKSAYDVLAATRSAAR
jgi:hypothetical protein